MIVSPKIVTAMAWLALVNVIALLALINYLFFGSRVLSIFVQVIAILIVVAVAIWLVSFIFTRYRQSKSDVNIFTVKPRVLEKLDRLSERQTGKTLTGLAKDNPQYAYFLLETFINRKLEFTRAEDGTGKEIDEFDLFLRQADFESKEFDLVLKVYRPLTWADILLCDYQPSKVLFKTHVRLGNKER